MIIKDWYILKQEFEDRRKELSPSQTAKPLKVKVLEGKREGDTGTMIDFDGTTPSIEFDDGKVLKIHYLKLGRLDEYGELIPSIVRDMIGAPFGVGSWVACANAYRNSYVFQICLVNEIKPNGDIYATLKAEDGEKARYHSIRKINATRCLKVPVEEDRFMLAVLSDFASITDTLHD